MTKERLSKLQKWILERCFKDLKVNYSDIFAFFNKTGTQRKPEFIGLFLDADLKKRYGNNYKKEFDIEKVERETRLAGYIWKGLKISRKAEFCITDSEKAVISRSLKGLTKKGFLIKPRKWGEYRLTKEGFVKANKFSTSAKVISFKEYQKRIEKAEKKTQEAYKKSLASITEAFKNKAK